MTDPTPWYADHDELVHFANVLVDTDWFESPRGVVYFFEKPWKWEPQHQLWEQSGRPASDAGATWDAFISLLAESDTVAGDRPPLAGL
jgi:hypothetical protein